MVITDITRCKIRLAFGRQKVNNQVDAALHLVINLISRSMTGKLSEERIQREFKVVDIRCSVCCQHYGGRAFKFGVHKMDAIYLVGVKI